MAIQIIAPADRTREVLGDLTKRRAEILNITTRGENKVNETLIASGTANNFFFSIFDFSNSGDQYKCPIGRAQWIFE